MLSAATHPAALASGLPGRPMLAALELGMESLQLGGEAWGGMWPAQ